MTRRWKHNPNPDAAWYSKHAKFSRPANPRPVAPPKEKLLSVSTGYFTAGAVWKKIYGVWSCTETAPILHWMRGKTPAEVHLALLKMGADFQWFSGTPKQSQIALT